MLLLDASGKRSAEKADAKIVNPLRLLAGDFDSDDFLTTDSADDTKPDSQPVLSGSETEEEEVVVVNEDSDNESDLGENDDFKARYPTVFNLPVLSAASESTSQNSQGGSHSLSQRQEQAAISIVPVKTVLVQRNGTPSSLVYKPLEATPYTQEQLARCSFPLTVDPNGPSVPQPLNRLLREYQRLGVQFLFDMYKNGRGGTLGDDMGLGKTIQGGFQGERSRRRVECLTLTLETILTHLARFSFACSHLVHLRHHVKDGPQVQGRLEEGELGQGAEGEGRDEGGNLRDEPEAWVQVADCSHRRTFLSLLQLGARAI